MKIKEAIKKNKINKVLNKCVGAFSDYRLSDGKLICMIEDEKLNLNFNNEDSYNLYLPGATELCNKLKLNCINEVRYYFHDRSFNKKLNIISEDDNVIITFIGGEYRNGINIKNATKVLINFVFGYSSSDDKYLYIKAKKIIFKTADLDINGLTKNITLSADSIDLIGVNIDGFETINFEASKICIYDSRFEAKNIYLNAKEIEECDNFIYAHEKLSISNKNCDLIKNVHSPVIIYNDIDITNSDGIQLPKMRQQLIEKLRQFRDNCSEKIENKVKIYKQNLESKPITKILRK